jgi:hypothetical protein
MKAQRGVEINWYCIFFTLGAWLEWVVNATPRPLDARGGDPVPVLPVDPTAGLEGCGKPRCTTGFRSLDRPARRKSVYLKTRSKHKMQNVVISELVVRVGNRCYSRSGLSGLRQRTRSYIFVWSSWLIKGKGRTINFVVSKGDDICCSYRWNKFFTGPHEIQHRFATPFIVFFTSVLLSYVKSKDTLSLCTSWRYMRAWRYSPTHS